MKILVCGYGNPYRMDDGVGHHLAPLLAEWLDGKGQEAKLPLEHQLLPEMADELARYDLAVFVDARVPSEEEKKVLVSEIVPDSGLDGLNIHSVGPEWILSLAESLGTSPPPAVLVSVEGESFDFGLECTPRCEERMRQAEQTFHRWFEERFGC